MTNQTPRVDPEAFRTAVETQNRQVRREQFMYNLKHPSEYIFRFLAFVIAGLIYVGLAAIVVLSFVLAFFAGVWYVVALCVVWCLVGLNFLARWLQSRGR